jgi:hypothetical protein
MRREFNTPVFQVTEKLPRPGEWVFVITASYRCMGYIDEKGRWKDVLRREVIEGVKAWSAASEEETNMWSKKAGPRQPDQ